MTDTKTAPDPASAAITPSAASDTPIIRARALSRTYGRVAALKPVSFDIPPGRIVGIIGANGAGKTTLLHTLLGLTRYDGMLEVLGLDPARQRDRLMQEICFIADVATLPRSFRVSELVDLVEDIHPRFERMRALAFLQRANIPLERRVRALSKGMTVQVHLALVLAIDARLLVLDEPTLGLDILFRKTFYRALLEEYFDAERTIVITTHQVEEIEHILSDVMFIKDGEMLLFSDMESLSARYLELRAEPGSEAAARALNPIAAGQSFGRQTFTYEEADPAALKPLGEVRRLGLADIFVAVMQAPNGTGSAS